MKFKLRAGRFTAFTGAQSAEVCTSLWHNVTEELQQPDTNHGPHPRQTETDASCTKQGKGRVLGIALLT